MNAGIQVREKSGTRAGVFLRGQRFDEVTKALGAHSDQARARLLAVDPKTIYRARRGVIGEEFIARVIDVMTRRASELVAVGVTPTFEAMFEIREKKA